MMQKAQHFGIKLPLAYPKASLAVLYVLWKLFLLLVAIGSPGSGYDTSTSLLPQPQSLLTSKLVRWDAIYYTQIAQRGYVFEQEWAFGWGYTHMLKFLAKCMCVLPIIGRQSNPVDLPVSVIREAIWSEAWAGLTLSNCSHMASILILYHLSKELFASHPKAAKIAFVSASLHIISPAGLFLCAPYSESLFSMTQFGAYYCYVRSYTDQHAQRFRDRDMLILAAGCLLGFATTVRGNGLLSGFIFAHDAVVDGIKLVRGDMANARLRKFMAVMLAGSLVALGAVFPQYLAFQEYCIDSGGPARPWCNQMVPSIYGFVQQHYWYTLLPEFPDLAKYRHRNVGFLRYWTMSNIPLFILALPMLAMMVQSSIWTWSESKKILYSSERVTTEQAGPSSQLDPDDKVLDFHRLLRCLTLPQLALALLALTSYHVQIITRLSSGYPVWYWWVAMMVVERNTKLAPEKSRNLAAIISKWMVMYAIIQGGLFSSFLPPA